MATVIVQFRLPKEDVAFLERHGIHPNEAARERLQGLIRSLRFGEAYDEIRKRPARRYFDPAKAVREAREVLDRRR